MSSLKNSKYFKNLYSKYNNNIPNVIAQVRSREGRKYADLTPTLVGKEVIPYRPLAQEKTQQTSLGKEITKENKIILLSKDKK